MRAAVRLEVGDGEAEKSEWNEFNTTRRVAPGSSISRQTKLTRSENLLIQRVPNGYAAGLTAGRQSNGIAKAPIVVLVMVEVPEPPCATVTEVGEAERLKPPAVPVPASASIRACPFGLPMPVTTS